MENKITAQHMEKYLAERYCDSRQWVFLTQVRSSTGSANRTADAMAFNMYGSTGYEILGFEIKVSRSDFLSELKDMSKSNEIMSYCDKWYMVVSDASIVKEGELPKNWGLLVLKDGKLLQKVRPTPQKPELMPLHFTASILRRSADEIGRIRSQYIPREEINGELEKARKDGFDDARGYNGKQTEMALKDLREKVAAFEAASGVQIVSYHGMDYTKTVGGFVKVATKFTDRYFEQNIDQMERSVKSIQEAVKEMRKIKSVINDEKDVEHVVK